MALSLTRAADIASRPPAEREALLGERLRREPRCAVTRYLLGCHEFDAGRDAHGVRQLMVAQHLEPALQSAALLVFTGLSWGLRRDEPLLTVLRATWEEFRRPSFDNLRKEQRLLDALAAPAPPLGDAAAHKFWRLPLSSLRSQLRAAAEGGLFETPTTHANPT